MATTKDAIRSLTKYFSVLTACVAFVYGCLNWGWGLDRDVKAHAEQIPELQRQVSRVPIIEAKINELDRDVTEVKQGVQFLVQQAIIERRDRDVNL